MTDAVEFACMFFNSERNDFITAANETFGETNPIVTEAINEYDIIQNDMKVWERYKNAS